MCVLGLLTDNSTVLIGICSKYGYVTSNHMWVKYNTSLVTGFVLEVQLSYFRETGKNFNVSLNSSHDKVQI